MDTWQTSSGSVFVCGSPYTEVSTVAWALSAHPAFWTSSESRFLYQLFGSRAGLQRPYLYDVYGSCTREGAWLRTNAVSYPEFLAALGHGIGALFQARAGQRRWVDSSPENALMLDELLLMFPCASFVGLLQPVRTALFLSERQGVPRTRQRAQALDKLNTLYAERLMAAARATPDRVYLLDEGDWLAQPESTLADLLEFLGEENSGEIAEVFSRRLLRLDLPLAEARTALARFERTLSADGPQDRLHRLIAMPSSRSVRRPPRQSPPRPDPPPRSGTAA
jgi:hypothetical protein